jgi:hypothetical protein
MLHAERIVLPRADGRPPVDVMTVASEIPLRRSAHERGRGIAGTVATMACNHSRPRCHSGMW